MNSIFIQLLNMSITASWIVLAVIILRLLLKEAPKWIRGVLWGFVALRLIFPFSIESVFSLIPSTETISQGIGTAASPAIDSGLPFVNQVINPVLSSTLALNTAESINPMQIITSVATYLWLAGMATMLLYAVVSYLRIYRKVRESVKTENGAYICDGISTPFILGIFRPKIYLPSSMKQLDTEFVLLHEKAHLKRRDHIWKPLGFLLLTVYWFNPALWIAYILLCRDIELACDEKVLKGEGMSIKKEYSDALINCSVPRRMVTACPLAFGEVGVKGRVKSVLNYKKPTFWIILVAVVACIATAVCLLTNPLSTKIDDQLKTFLDMKIAEQHKSDKTEDNFLTSDCKILGTKKNGSETTIYAWILYQEYSYNGELKVESGSHIPTAITVRKTDNSGDSGIDYELVEYWIPRDGSYYADDIKDKFPLSLRSKALDNNSINEQKANCLKSAQEYYGISVSAVGGADEPNNITINPSDYSSVYQCSSEKDIATISLDPQGKKFSFSFSLLSSYIAMGTYEENNEFIVAHADGNNDKYTFKKSGQNMLFIGDKSSQIPSYSYSSNAQAEVCLADGAVFLPTETKDVKSDAKANSFFNAEVLEVDDKSILVKPDADSEEIKSADKISVSLDFISTIPHPSFKAGDRVQVIYNGEIAESYPAQIHDVFAIYSLDENGEVIRKWTN